ncbi:MAG TPA: hypothetical protein H9958_07170 [Candidatus Limosilactobacillus intestinavium]|nr:hypothetical protein [Candidatus Limosilactobacillus intestinavium]
MTKLVINGHHALKGAVGLSGDQQTVMAIQAACLLATQGTMILDNVPNTQNINLMNRLLQTMNVQVDYNRHQNVLKMDATCKIRPLKISGPALLTSGAILARCHHVQLVDNGLNTEYQHDINALCNGFQKFGATIEKVNEGVNIRADKLTGQNINLESAGLTPTLTMMMAATLAQGITVLKNPNHNPVVVELAKVLNKMGGRVHGAGTDTIRIQGVTFLHSTDYLVLDDQEEAGFYLVLGAATAGDILVQGAHPEHLNSLIQMLDNMGNTVIVQKNGIRVIGTSLLLSNNIDISEYLQLGKYGQMAILGLLMLTNGETVVDGFNVEQLNIIGNIFMNNDGQIQHHNHQLKIIGPLKHYPKTISTTSTAEGMLSLVFALGVKQITTIDPAEVVSSSFTNLIDKLVALGAQIDLSFD